jgi:hypothetical protein
VCIECAAVGGTTACLHVFSGLLLDGLLLLGCHHEIFGELLVSLNNPDFCPSVGLNRWQMWKTVELPVRFHLHFASDLLFMDPVLLSSD